MGDSGSEHNVDMSRGGGDDKGSSGKGGGGKDLRCTERGICFVVGVGGRPSGKGRGEGSIGWLGTGDDRTELG